MIQMGNISIQIDQLYILAYYLLPNWKGNQFLRWTISPRWVIKNPTEGDSNWFPWVGQNLADEILAVTVYASWLLLQV